MDELHKGLARLLKIVQIYVIWLCVCCYK